MDKNQLSEEFINLLALSDEGVQESAVKSHFQDRYASLASIINDLVESNRLQLFTQGGLLVYKILKEETAVKFDGLGPEQMLVYQAIERSGNRGIWTRDIKVATNIQQQVLTKTLKTLEQRNLIKSVRSVVSKSKKLYMLYHLDPAKEISGGPWYTDQEFDHEFLEFLSREIIHFVKSNVMANLTSIADRIRVSGICKVELSKEDIELVVQTLVYDGKLEEVKGSVLAMTGQLKDSNGTMYKVCKQITLPNYYTDIPCGVCPLIDRCTEGGVISPSTCEYMSLWLSANSDEGGGW